MDIERQRAWGRIGGLTAHARNDPQALTAPARNAFWRRFEAQVDPDGVLPTAERDRRTQRLLRAHMLTLAERSAAARRRPPEGGKAA